MRFSIKYSIAKLQITLRKKRNIGHFYYFWLLIFNMNIVIRPFSFDDLPAILDIVNYHILHTTAVYDYDARTIDQQRTILQEKLDKNFPFLVAQVDEKIVGFGTYGEFRFKKAYQFTAEHSVYINKDFHGIGIGKLLLSNLIAIAKNRKIHTLVAVIDSENSGSVDFHKKFGFETIGVIKQSGYKFDKWLDSVLMQLLLN